MVRAAKFPMVRVMWQVLATAGLLFALAQALPAKAMPVQAERIAAQVD